MKYLFFSFFTLLCFNLAVGQNKKPKEDMAYELKHKSANWYQAMLKPNANYFEVKKNFDKYFALHKWEKSKPRNIGESWIKSALFYLNKNGIVQDAPLFDDNARKNLNSKRDINATTRTVGSWTMIGPVNSARTGYSSNYNHGGYVYLNRIDPTNPQKMFASFLLGGLWMTTNGGTDWTLTDANMPAEYCKDIDVCRDAPNTVYAIMKSRVIKSIDGGLTWSNTALISPAYSGNGYDIAVSPLNPDIVVAKWDTKIYRTINGGTTWTLIQSSLPNYGNWECSENSEVLDWSSTDNNVVYCLSTPSANAKQVNVYRSADAGATFALITTITLDPTAVGQVVGWSKLLLPSNNSNEIYIALGSGNDAYGHKAVQFYKLNNITGAEVLKRVNMLDGTGTKAMHHGDIVMDRGNENKIVYGTYSPDRVYYSVDNGQSFSTSTATHSDVRSVDMVNDKVLVGSDGEIAYSSDGGATLATISNSISNHELWGFGSAFKTDIVGAGTNHGPAMVKENGSGFEWYNLSGADQGNTDVNPLDDRYVYSQGYSNYRYFRTGVHTMINESNMLDAGGIYSYFNSMEFHPNLYYSLVTHHAGQYPTGNPNLATWKNSLIKTIDNGATISIVKTFTEQVFREKFCITNPNVMYVIVGLTNNKVWKTIDGGLNWNDVTPTLAQSLNRTNISDIAVSDVDPDLVYITYSSVQNTCKVLKTINGGTSWALEGTQSTLTTNPNTKIIFQRGSNGGVYVANKSGVYYKNNTMPDWVMLGNGLPDMEIRFMFINYNLGKLRIGTSRGAWEHDLYETSPPKAQISADKNKLNCARDIIQFKDYSTVRNASATWAWSFPGGTPATSNQENPTVTYTGSAVGSYDVSLTVTDAFGTSTQTLTNFIEILGNECNVDTIPGKLLTLSASGDYAQQSSALNITTNTITLSGWIKPNGTQSSNAGLIFTGSNGATGLNYSGNKLGYHWRNEAGSYNFNSNLIIPENEWSNVALVIWPDSAILYLNGVPAKRTATHGTANFNNVFQFGIDRGNTSRNFNGEMDEISIYNRSLSTDEIRDLMNLTRNNPNTGSLPQTDASLLAYYQFNEGAGKPAYDKIGNNHVNIVGGALKTNNSTAPVGGGTFERIRVNSGGIKDFTKPGIELTFPSSGPYPNGDIVVTRVDVPSDQLAATIVLPTNPVSYFVIRNYGINQTFAALTSMKFKNIQGTSNDMITTPQGVQLFKRLSNDFGTTWGLPIDNADVAANNSGTGTIEFSTDLTNTTFSQYSLGINAAILPVQLISFSATNIDNNKVHLKWAIATETNLRYYEIERSTDGVNFIKIGTVSSIGQSNYSIYDDTPMKGLNYYRLKFVGADNVFKYSNVKIVIIVSKVNFTIIQSVNQDHKIGFKIQGAQDNTGANLSVTNIAGQLIKSLYLTMNNNSQYFTSIDVAGVYLVRLTLNDGQTFTKKIVVQN